MRADAVRGASRITPCGTASHVLRKNPVVPVGALRLEGTRARLNGVPARNSEGQAERPGAVA